MRKCPKCGNEVSDNADICLKCKTSLSSKYSNYDDYNTDTVSVWLVILSFFIPLFGLIYLAVHEKEYPDSAKKCGIAAVVSYVLNIVVIVCLLSKFILK